MAIPQCIIDTNQPHSNELYKLMQKKFLEIDLKIRKEIIESMTPRMGLILMLRSGMVECENNTYYAIGKKIGLSKVRINQICCKAYRVFFKKYNEFINSKALPVYIDATPAFTFETLERISLLEESFAATDTLRFCQIKKIEQRLIEIGDTLHKLSLLTEIANKEHEFVIERIRTIVSAWHRTIQRITDLESSHQNIQQKFTNPLPEWSWSQSYNCEGQWTWPQKK